MKTKEHKIKISPKISGCISPKEFMNPLEFIKEFLDEKTGKKKDKLPDIKDKVIY